MSTSKFELLRNTKKSAKKTSASQISPKLQAVLQRIVDDVVASLGCLGAMLATLEGGNALPLRAYAVNFNTTIIDQLEKQVGLTLISPTSVTYLDDDKYKNNLSVRAVKGPDGRPQKFVVSNSLHDLFRPFVPKQFSDLAQRLVGVKQVMAVPFFLEDEVVGNLFAATKTEFSQRDIDFLTAFGYQAASAIQSQRYLAETQALERVILVLQSKMTDETQILQAIVDAVVYKLDYAGTMVSTLEDNALPMRAYAFDAGDETLKQLRQEIKNSLDGSKMVMYLNNPDYESNLGIKAISGKNGRPEKFVVSNSLYDLFRPILSQETSNHIQKLAGIKQVIAVPIFLEDEVVGNLFVATRRTRFSERNITILTTLAQQAAVGIRNAQLYRIAEERRQIAQMFGKMAFSAAANVHGLRNHIGSFRAYLGLLDLLPQLPPDQQKELLETGPEVMAQLNKAADVLDSLHEPWRQTPDIPTDVNRCLIWAARGRFPKNTLTISNGDDELEEGFFVHKSLTSDLPLVQTSPDMLTEAFKIIIKNAVEAMRERSADTNAENHLWLESHLPNGGLLEVIIRDNGTGIAPENLNKIFDMGWSTKKGAGMGFGLFWTKDYIEGLNGEIEVESTLNKGTTFKIKIPYV